MKDGGIYADIDMTPFDLSPYLSEFIIPYGRHRNQLNPTLIITPPNHAFILQTIDAYKKISLTPYSYWGWSIVHIMSVLNAANKSKVPKLLEEQCPVFESIYNCTVYDHKLKKSLSRNRSSDYNPISHKFDK